MDLRYLYEFIVLARTENYLEASELLYISQPTLSRHIKMLEDEIGKPLFSRTTRQVSLTEYGHLLSDYASKIVEIYEEFTNRLQMEEVRNTEKNSVVVAGIPAMKYYGMIDVFNYFRKMHPEYPLRVYLEYEISVAEKLRQREVAFTFIRARKENMEDERVSYIPFASDHIVAFVSNENELAVNDSISLSELKNERLISLPPGTQVGEIIRSACLGLGFSPKIVMSDHNIDHLIEYVRMDMGIGVLLSKHLNQKYNDLSDIKILEVTPRTSSFIHLCYLKNAEMNKGEKAFLDMFRDLFAGSGIEES